MFVSKWRRGLFDLQSLHSLVAIQIVLFAFHVKGYALFLDLQIECFLSNPKFH